MKTSDAGLRFILRSRWRVTAVDALPGVGTVDLPCDQSHEDPVSALTATIATLRAAHPELAANDVEWRMVPVHRGDA